MARTKHKTSLYVIKARAAPVAVIFRRGSSKLVRLIKWNMAQDTFELGQWFKGRIYERLCDVSPNGELLVYLAASHKPPHYTWTAVSKPPYLTALAFWPGGPWSNGGCFRSDKELLVFDSTAKLAEGYSLPAGFRIVFLEYDSGKGDNVPSWLGDGGLRYGWRVMQQGTVTEYKCDALISYSYDPPQVCGRCQVIGRTQFELRTKLTGIGERNGDRCVIDYELENLASGETVALGRLGWADWDRNGDLLYAKGGKLFRLANRDVARLDLALARDLADFSGLTFEEVPPPDYARRW